MFRLGLALSRRLAPACRCPTPAITAAPRWISTSKQNKETTTVGDIQPEAAPKKNWVSYGFSFDNEEEDKQMMHSVFFSLVTIALCLGSFVVIYMPDLKLRDWGEREAFIEIRRRELQGLPMVDANLVDPSKFELPSDEELGDTEIII